MTTLKTAVWQTSLGQVVMNREEKSLRHAAIAAKFLDDNATNPKFT